MLADKTILAIIPARGGSKGIKRKNLRMIKDNSLLAHTIRIAKKSRWIDRLIVSTEDDEIMQHAKEAGAEVPFVRPIELAQDETTGVEPILHALTHLPNYDYVIVLQPTSPLRNASDIDECLNFIITKNAPACVSICQSDIHPQWMFAIDSQQQLQKISSAEMPMRRQDLPLVYHLNGAIYVAKTPWLLQTKTFITNETLAYVMPKERSIDIDNELDLKIAELVMENFS